MPPIFFKSRNAIKRWGIKKHIFCPTKVSIHPVTSWKDVNIGTSRGLCSWKWDWGGSKLRRRHWHTEHITSDQRGARPVCKDRRSWVFRLIVSFIRIHVNFLENIVSSMFDWTTLDFKIFVWTEITLCVITLVFSVNISLSIGHWTLHTDSTYPADWIHLTSEPCKKCASKIVGKQWNVRYEEWQNFRATRCCPDAGMPCCVCHWFGDTYVGIPLARWESEYSFAILFSLYV